MIVGTEAILRTDYLTARSVSFFVLGSVSLRSVFNYITVVKPGAIA